MGHTKQLPYSLVDGDTFTRFLDRVLDPLSAAVMPADCELSRVERELARNRWHEARHHVYVTGKLFKFRRDLIWHDIEACGVSREIWEHFPSPNLLRDHYTEALANMILTIAPTKCDASWKRAQSKWSMIPLTAEQIEAAIAADEAFIAAHAPRRMARKGGASC